MTLKYLKTIKDDEDKMISTLNLFQLSLGDMMLPSPLE